MKIFDDGRKAAHGRGARASTQRRRVFASSDKISRIIKVIDEIAFQTNILALNAVARNSGPHRPPRQKPIPISPALAARVKTLVDEVNLGS
ncbi:MAG TPA: methyl-accepting chemotaxis protein [Bryobacteraceae bacterium]|nr:methyl-accepting chemotaxis protein [Bryobacteraceae bacterium]